MVGRSRSETNARAEAYKSALIGTQATAVLQGIYVGRVSNRLQAQEDKQKKQNKGRLNSDGQGKLLTGDKFRTLVDKHADAMEREKVERENRKKRKEAHSELMTTWKEVDEARKQRNKERQEAYQEQLRHWEEERELAKLEKHKVGWVKPKRGKLEGAPPRPGAKSGTAAIEAPGGGNENDTDEGMETDGGSEDE